MQKDTKIKIINLSEDEDRLLLDEHASLIVEYVQRCQDMGYSVNAIIVTDKVEEEN